jgi:hypothetical protein
MFSIVETLNEFRTMLLCYCIKIYIGHENLTRLTTVSKSPRIQRWHWTIEEFGPTIAYIKGPRNVVADALSRLDTDVSSTTASSKQIAELYEKSDDKSLQDLDYPLSTQIIAGHQCKDQTLIQHQQCHPEYFSKTVDGQQVILFNNKIYITKTLRKPILRWYHSALQHSTNRKNNTFISSMARGSAKMLKITSKAVTSVKGVKIPVRNTDIYLSKILIKTLGTQYVLTS